MRSPTTITIGLVAGGAWRVSTPDDLVGGVFVSRKAALAFARDEAAWTKRRPVIAEAPPELRGLD